MEKQGMDVNSMVEDGPERLAHVVSHFRDSDEFPWVLAAGAIGHLYKHLSGHANNVLVQFDLTMPRFEVLALLHHEPGFRSVADLKRATLIHPPTMTYTLDWLEERGLVEREHDTVDRRSIIVHITKKGSELAAKTHAALRDVNYGLPLAGGDDAMMAAEALIKLLGPSEGD